MKTISFTIRGNHEDRGGNPLPYFRMTQKTKWRPEAQRYLGWCAYVRAALYDSGIPFTLSMVQQYSAGRPPLELEPGQYASVSIMVYWADLTHGDLDNVLKGILDSLFVNDKRVNKLHAEYAMSPDICGRVEVTINLTD